MTLTTILTVLPMLAFINVATFCAYWWDKDAARNGHWRISERTLLLLAFAGCSPAALMARRLLRHKTRKHPFAAILNGIVVLQLLFLVSLVAMPLLEA